MKELSYTSTHPLGHTRPVTGSLLKDGIVGQRHASAALNPGKRVGGWVGPRAGLDVYGKSRLQPRIEPLTVQPVASRYTD